MSLKDKLAEKEKERDQGYEVAFWKPQEGEILEGVVTEFGETITEFGDAEYAQVETEGKKYMVFLNFGLKKQVDAEGVKEGDRVAIKFLGLVQSKKSKRKFKDYLLVKEDADNPTEE